MLAIIIVVYAYLQKILKFLKTTSEYFQCLKCRNGYVLSQNFLFDAFILESLNLGIF